MLVRGLILILIMGCFGTTFSQKRIPVDITRFYDSREVKRFTFINIKLIENGEELVNINFDEKDDTTKLSVLDTISIMENSSLHFEINYTIAPIDENSITTSEKESLDFFVSGNENKLGFNVFFDLVSNSKRKLRSITVIKYFDGHKMAKLVPRKSPYTDAFEIVNISQNPIYGTGMGNEFWSDLYISKNGIWEKPPMSVMLLCGNMHQTALNYNDTAAISFTGVPNFPGSTPFILIPAKYKIINTFTETPEGQIVPSNDISKRIYIYYQTSTEFEIK